VHTRRTCGYDHAINARLDVASDLLLSRVGTRKLDASCDTDIIKLLCVRHDRIDIKYPGDVEPAVAYVHSDLHTLVFVLVVLIGTI
jgi:hypothetical protein